MKVLIVDDEPRRYGRLIDELVKNGLERDSIHHAVCTNQAREHLEAVTYDLLVLDILVPLWPDSESDAQHSLDLLFELHEDDGLIRPRRIIGITADQDAAEKARASFDNYTWAIIRYSADDDSWLSKVLACVRYADPAAQASEHLTADIVVICALAEPELAYVLRLPWDWSPEQKVLADGTFVSIGYAKDETGRTLTVAAAHASRMGMVSSALLASALITVFDPKAVVMTGICAGLRGKAKLGDVLLADPSWDFQSGKLMKRGDDTVLARRPHQLPAPNKVRRFFQALKGDQAAVDKLSAAFTGPRPRNGVLLYGPVASGSAVLADGEAIQDIKKEQHDEVIGVEMEIYGVYSAAASAPNSPLAFAIKGVCDFADPDKSDDSQEYAAYMSANVLRVLIETYGSKIIGER